MISNDIQRQKTALYRVELSRPLKVAIADGLVSEFTSVFDYGCGRGGDLKRLRSRNIACSGWDPSHRPSAPRVSADVVNLGYVLNVIENPRERVETLQAAWNLASQILVVSVQLESEMKGARLRPHEDGFITGANTFQKYFSQAELRDWVEAVLEQPCIAAGPGILYAFRDERRREEFAASRYRRARASVVARQSDILLEQHREALQPIIEFLDERGRLPVTGELGSEGEIHDIFGSIKRAGLVLRRALGSEAWNDIRRLREEDLLLYVALSRFSRRPRFSALPELIRNDIKSFFGSYKRAAEVADVLLYSLGDPTLISNACAASKVGKLMPTALYVHRSALDALPLQLRLYEGCGRNYLGDVEEANVIKLGRGDPRISYLAYPDFESRPHPVLRNSLTVSLQTFRIKERDYSSTENPPILHRKEEFVGTDYPLHGKFKRLTEQEERFGLFDSPSTIGTFSGWMKALEGAKVRLRGHRVIRVRDPGDED